MKKLVALLCLISALVSSAFSIQCRYCHNPSTYCKETVINCPTDICMANSLWTYEHGNLIKMFWKGCGDEKSCGMERLENSGMDMYKISIKCCTSDLCNTHPYAYKDLEPLEKILMDAMDLCYTWKGKLKITSKLDKLCKERK
ncbi:uncharacterized protein ACNLHF_002589 [Anomaloglossus baeobatrachus]